MDPVESSYPLYGVGNNPFILEYLSQLATHHEEALHEAQPGPEVRSAPESALEIDQARLSVDGAYLASTLKTLLERARFYFNAAMYADALREYREYIYLEHLYATGYSGVTGEYFQVIFEYLWLLDLTDHRKEVERAFNQALLERVAPVLKPAAGDRLETRMIRQLIGALQELEQFPTYTRLQEPVPVEVLMKIAKKALSQGEGPLAQMILGFVEVRHLLGFFRTERLVQSISEQGSASGIRPSVMLPIIYARIGLPYAPLNPLAVEESKRILSKESARSIFHTEPVPPIAPIDKDPDEDEERERRGRKFPPIQKKGQRPRGE